MYRPKDDIGKLSLRFQAQAASRRASWAGRIAGLRLRGTPKDKEVIEKIIAYAQEHSSTARQALAWAQAHGVAVTATRKKEMRLGYYHAGVVTLCLSRLQQGHFIDYPRCVETLVHEIRHAWQDYYGLLSVSPLTCMGSTYTRTSDVLIAQALYEADAYALGQLASKECQRHEVGNPAAALRLEFMRWFNQYADIYRTNETLYLECIKSPLARMIAGCFNLRARRLQHAMVDWPLYISRLGRTFDGFDYLASLNDDQRDKALRLLLTPAHALGQSDTKARIGAYKLELQDRQRRLAYSRIKPRKVRLPT